MKDYARRSAKFIAYIVVIFILFLGVVPLIASGKPMATSFEEMIHNERFILFFGLLIAYGLAYPTITFVKIKRHLNGTFENNREKFEKAFSSLDYIKTEETPEKLVYRKKSGVSRFMQWYEDSITVTIAENPVVISGYRRWVVRIDRIIDNLLLKEAK
jgi:hypothetical protein